jgi:hypothetical protein
MSFGDFIGIGEDYYPLPWSLFTYNPHISDEQLQDAPKCGTSEHWDWINRSRAVDDSYGIQTGWMFSIQRPPLS